MLIRSERKPLLFWLYPESRIKIKKKKKKAYKVLLKCLHGHRRFQHCKPFTVSSTFKGRGLIRLCCCSVSKSHPTLCDPTDCSMPGLPILHCLPKFAQTHVHRVNDAIHHLVLCCLLFLLPSIFPSIRVFSNESALHIRWPKYWSFSFSISSSNEYSGLFPLAWPIWSPCQPRYMILDTEIVQVLSWGPHSTLGMSRSENNKQDV